MSHEPQGSLQNRRRSQRKNKKAVFTALVAISSGSKRQAKFLEVDLGESRQERPIDLVVGKDRLIFRQSDLGQPFRNLPHPPNLPLDGRGGEGAHWQSVGLATH